MVKISAKKGLNLLSEIVRISNSTIKLDERLEAILENISISFSFKKIALYVLDTEKRQVNLKVAMGATFKKTVNLDEDPIELCKRSKENFLSNETCRDFKFLISVQEDPAMGGGAIFPIADDKFYYGIIVVILNESEKPDNESVQLMQAITHEIAGTMRNAQLYSKAKDTVNELLVLNDIWNTMSSTLDLDDLLDITINKARSCLESECGIIKLYQKNGEEEKIVSCNADRFEGHKLIEICDEIYKEIQETGEATILEEGILERLNCPTDAVMAAPIIHQGDCIGSVTLFGREDDGRFEKREKSMFSTIASQISAIIGHALLIDETKVINREKELMVRELTTLFELNKAVMTTIDLDRLFHIILTAVTIGDGFGFNRAMLFLYNENTGLIQGMMGVGPDSAEDAWKVWSEIFRHEKTLKDFVEEKELELPQSKLNEMVKRLRVSIEGTSILGLTVKEEKSFNIKDVSHDPRVNQELLSQLHCRAFATAPLMASGKVVGIILVDNIFNDREITDDDIRLLTIFANQAGMAIDNSVLYKNLEKAHSQLKEAHNKLVHTEKLAALGEMAAGVAHEIRNPLVSIGGFARRLSRKLEDSEESHYVNIICKEVERLEIILNDILVFAREDPLALGIHNINSIIDDTLQFFINDFNKSNIRVDKEFGEEIEFVEANFHQLKQVFINLFSNARHAMEGGGTLSIKSYRTEIEGGVVTTVEISDTGSGIPYNIISNVFNPFFTTKDTGTGLGLAITHKIISTYGGDIEVFNNDEGGATFVITLPSKKMEQFKKEGGTL